jgi:flagellar basal-body rod protein FlgF
MSPKGHNFLNGALRGSHEVKGVQTLKDLWVPLSGAIAQQRKVETIAHNVANANTPGFKKDHLAFKEYLTEIEKGNSEIDLPNKEWKPEDFYKSYGAENSKVMVAGSFTNFQQGQLVPTGSPLDLGIQGKGFFEFLTPNGVRYGRKGTFTLNGEGVLVNEKGYPVLGSLEIPETPANQPALPQPSERMITIKGNSIVVMENGEILLDGRKRGALSIVEFKDPHSLRKEGNSLFINRDVKNILAQQTNTKVRQGFLEQSNVNAIEEMSKLLKAHRHFESIQKVIKAYDTLSGKAVNEISRF